MSAISICHISWGALTKGNVSQLQREDGSVATEVPMRLRDRSFAADRDGAPQTEEPFTPALRRALWIDPAASKTPVVSGSSGKAPSCERMRLELQRPAVLLRDRQRPLACHTEGALLDLLLEPSLRRVLPMVLLGLACAGCVRPPVGDRNMDAGRADAATSNPDGSVSSDAGAAGACAGFFQDAGPPPSVPPYAPVVVSSAVGKVKNLLTGLPPTDAEISAVTADQTALSGLVAGWMTTPQYQDKMLEFFKTAFQQKAITWQELVPQFYALSFPPFPQMQSAILGNLTQSFPRTAAELVAEGQPFTSTMTTTRFMMTPALMAAYALLDTLPIMDSGSKMQIPIMSPVVFESAGPIPLASAVDPANAGFLHFYDPALAQPYLSGCPDGTLTYPPPVLPEILSTFLLNQSMAPFDIANGVVIPDTGPIMGDLWCQPPSSVPLNSGYLAASDFTTWQMVTIRQPQAGESTTPFYDFPSFRAGKDLVLHIPRVSFFTTIPFFGQWQTNQSNLARVTANQTLIVGLGMPEDLTNTTAPPSVVALDRAHAAPGTECYDCHLSLDPMRQFFRQSYTTSYSQQTDGTETALPGSFGFHGVSAAGSSIFDLGTLLANHPLFATAWVQKLCTWANSTQCDESDPEFMRLVSVFASSNFSWPTLVQALFSSPIVTNLTETPTADQSGEVFPIARQAHLCSLLSNRLGLTDACGLLPGAMPGPDLIPVQTIAASWPSDGYARGSAVPVLANAPSVFTRSGMENLCSALANHLIDNPATGQFQSSQSGTAIQSFVTTLMGLGSDRGPAALSVLQGHYAAAMAANATPTVALKSTFVLACLSPYVIGVGL
jgi:hypothetical protein